jgi:hypothetical protein
MYNWEHFSLDGKAGGHRAASSVSRRNGHEGNIGDYCEADASDAIGSDLEAVETRLRAAHKLELWRNSRIVASEDVTHCPHPVRVIAAELTRSEEFHVESC